MCCGQPGSLAGFSPVLRALARSRLPELDIWEYVRSEIYEAPSALPDGRYGVSFDGRADIKKLDGNWLAGEA